MTQLNTLLELRSKTKIKKPDFIRQDNPKRPKLNDKWRKPKGIHSKIRHHFKGRRKMPSPGYKSPAIVRGLHSTGLKIKMVSSPEELSAINKDSEGIIIAKSVGARKKLAMLKKSREMSVRVLNLNAEESIKKIEDHINSKKKAAKETKKEPVKETKKSEESAQELTDEEKKKSEKQEKDKVLTKRM